MRRSGLSISDRPILAQRVGRLGRSRVFANLNQMAHAADGGFLPATAETRSELSAALADRSETRRMLMASLGLNPEPQP